MFSSLFAFFFFKKIATGKDIESRLRQVHRPGWCMCSGVVPHTHQDSVGETACLPPRGDSLPLAGSPGAAPERLPGNLQQRDWQGRQGRASEGSPFVLRHHCVKLCLTRVFMKYSCLLKPREVQRAGKFKYQLWEPVTRQLTPSGGLLSKLREQKALERLVGIIPEQQALIFPCRLRPNAQHTQDIHGLWCSP